MASAGANGWRRSDARGRSSIHFTGRPSRSAADAYQHVLGIKLAAHAEAAADMALVADGIGRADRGRACAAIWSRFQCGTLAAPCISEDVARGDRSGRWRRVFHRHAGVAADGRASSSTMACAAAERGIDVAVAFADLRRLGRAAVARTRAPAPSALQRAPAAPRCRPRQARPHPRRHKDRSANTAATGSPT